MLDFQDLSEADLDVEGDDLDSFLAADAASSFSRKQSCNTMQEGKPYKEPDAIHRLASETSQSMTAEDKLLMEDDY